MGIPIHILFLFCINPMMNKFMLVVKTNFNQFTISNMVRLFQRGLGAQIFKLA